MRTRHLRAATWFLVLVLLVCFPSTGKAQQNDNDVTRSELQNFDAYLDKHLDVRADLSRNPNLIDDAAYLNRHPHLKNFLKHHPNTRRELKENPAGFMQREKAREKSEAGEVPRTSDITQSELRNWDAYLDKHKDVERDLSRNPNLIDDSAYLNNHPHLKAFLEQHPNTRRELKENPKAFMSRERGYEKKGERDRKH